MDSLELKKYLTVNLQFLLNVQSSYHPVCFLDTYNNQHVAPVRIKTHWTILQK